MLPESLRFRPSALLLDAGDTLLFFDAEAFVAALASEGVTLDPLCVAPAMFAAKRAYQATLVQRQNHEDGWSMLIRELLVGCGIAPAAIGPLLVPLRRIHDEFYYWRRVPVGLPAALDRARSAGLRLAVLSNSEGKIESMLERVGLRGLLEFVIDSHHEGVSKPNPEIFRRAAARLDLEARQVLYAGDIPEVDVLGARAAGMHGVLVDAFDHYAGSEWPRVNSVDELVSELLTLPPQS